MRFSRILFLSSILVIFTTGTLPAQSPRELKLANTLAGAGNYEAALEIYLRIYRSGNQTIPVIKGIQKSYENLGRYEELIVFLEEVVRQNPNNFNYHIDLGTAYYRNNEREQAMRTWQQIYQQKPPNLMRYRLVASAMVQVRLFDEAIAVYRQAMQDLENQTTMHLDIGTLYRAQLNYEEAVRHYLLYYSHFNKKYSYVQSMIISMTRDDEATDRILAALSEFIAQHGADPQLRELQAGLFIKKKDFNRAYEIYSELYSNKSDLQFLMKFAGEAERNHAYEYAVKALEKIRTTLNNEQRERAIDLDLARNYYKLGVRDNQEAPVRQALTFLEGIGDSPLEKNVYYQSLELTGDIHRNYYQDYDRAIEAFSRILRTRSSGSVADRIRLKLGRTYFMKNDLTRAARFYKDVSGASGKKLSQYYTAQLYYFNGQFGRAKDDFHNLLNSISMNDSLANNVLNYISHLTQFARDSLELARFAEAERLEEQYKYSEAAENFEELARPGTMLGLRAGIRSARLFIRLNEYERAAGLLADLMNYFDQQPRLDEVLFLMAGVYRELEEPARALEYYQQLLSAYPDSFYLDEAREQARALSTRVNRENTP